MFIRVIRIIRKSHRKFLCNPADTRRNSEMTVVIVTITGKRDINNNGNRTLLFIKKATKT